MSEDEEDLGRRSDTVKPLPGEGLLGPRVGQRDPLYHSTRRSLRQLSLSQTTLACLCAFRLGRTEPNGRIGRQVWTLTEYAEGCWQADETLREPR